ncbi:mucin-binding protein [Streptococcus mitis]|uniref:mucin-binding protein n=1 Tax=Streptococcus mitis TaxID=28037 RepID=UPI0039EF7B19
MKGKQQDFRTEKYIRYGIRKYSFGAASVAIAAGLMFLGNGAVSATEVEGANELSSTATPTPTIGDEGANQDANSSKPNTYGAEPVLTRDGGEDTASSQPSAENTEAVATSSSAEIVADKAGLKAIVSELELRLSKINRTKVPASTIANAEKVLEDAKRILAKENASQLEVNEIAKASRSQASIIASMPKVLGETPAAVENKVEAAPAAVENKVEAAPATPTATEAEKRVEAANAELATVQEDLARYLPQAEKLATDSVVIESAKATLQLIKSSLVDANITIPELEKRVQEAKRVRNSLVNLVTGSNSGSRDSRNGQAMKEGSQLLAASDYISTPTPNPNGDGTYTIKASSPTKENHTGADIYEFNATAAKQGDVSTEARSGDISTLETIVYSNQRSETKTNEGNAGQGVNNAGRMDYPLTKEQAEDLAKEAEFWKGRLRIDGSTISTSNNLKYGGGGGYEYLATHIYHYVYEQGQDRVYIDKIKERFDLTANAKVAGWTISKVEPRNLPKGLTYNADSDTIEGKIVDKDISNGVYDTRTYVTYTNTKTNVTVRVIYRNLRGGWIGWQDTTPPTIESDNTVHKGTVGEEIAPVDIRYNDNSGSRITTERANVSYTLANGKSVQVRNEYGNGISGISGNISTSGSTVDTAIPGLTYRPNAGATPITENGQTVGYDGKGLISGIPTKAGVYHVTAYAKDYNRTERASGSSQSWNYDTQEGRGELTFVIAPKVTVKNIATYDTTVPVTISDGATYAEITTPDGSKTILKTKAGKWVVQEGTTNTAVSVGAEVGTVGNEFSLSVKPEATATAGVSKISVYAKTENVTANLMRTKVELNSATTGKKYTAVLNPKSGRYELAPSDATVQTELNDNSGNYTITKREVSTRAQTNGSMKFDLYEYTRTYNNANKVTAVKSVDLTETVYNKEDTANTDTGNGMYITVQYDKNSEEWSASDKSTVKARKTGDDTWKIETSSGYTGTVRGIMAENTSTSTIINSKPTATSNSYESTLNTTVNLIDRPAVVTGAKVSVRDTEDDKLATSTAEDAFKESHKTKVTSITVTDPDGNTVFAETTSGDAANYPTETSLKLTKVGKYSVTINVVDSNTNLVDGTTVGDTTAGTDHGVNTSTATTTYTITVKAGIEGTPATTSDIQGAVQKGTPSFNFDDEEKTKISATTNGTKVYSLESTNATDNTGATVGTYAINENTGEVTFTPNPTFVGTPNPAKVTLTLTVDGVDPLTSTAAYTPTVIGVKPEGTKVSSTDIQGQVQTGKPTFTPGSAEVNGARKTVPLKADSYKLLDNTGTEVTDGATTPAYAAADNGTVKAGDVIGTFGIDKSTGLVTFTPTNKAYVGSVKAVQVVVSDNNGTQPENDKRGEYTPNILGVTPTASEASTTGIQGAVQKSEVVLNAKDENVNTLNFSKGSEIVNGTEKSVDLNEATLTLVGADGEGKVSVAGQGTYSIVKEDGKSYVQFTPVATYTGNVTPVTVKIADANGTEVTTIYTPKIVGVKPSAEPSKTTGIQGETQTSAIKFDAADTDDTTVNFAKGTAIINSESKSVELDKTSVKLVGAENGTVNDDGSVTVANQGTYKLVKDETGAIAVTFTPLATFTGEAHAVTVSITDANGTEATTTYTPTVVAEDGTVIVEYKDEEGNVISPSTTPVNNEKVTTPFTTEPKEIPGYTLVKVVTTNGTVDEATKKVSGKVTNDTTTVTYTYRKNVQTATISYYDVTTGAEVAIDSAKVPAASVETVEGVHNGAIDFTNREKAIAALEKAGYTLVEDSFAAARTADKLFDNDTAVTQNFKVTVEQRVEPVTPNDEKPVPGQPVDPEDPNSPVWPSTAENLELTKTVTRTIKYRYNDENGEEVTADEVQTVTFTRSASINLVTGNVEYTDWSAAQTLEEVVSPEVANYTYDKETVASLEVTNESTDSTVYVIYKPVVPTSTPATSTDIQGKVQTGTPTYKHADGTELKPTTDNPAKFVGTEETTIPATKDGKTVGTYTIAPTGTVTFTPNKDFVGTPDPAKVVVTDPTNGTTVESSYTPTVTPVTPTGVDTGSAGPKNTPQSGTPTFVPGHKDVPMDNTVPATFEGGTTSKTVPNEGTYTVDATGKVTFTPNKDFVGTATGVVVVRKDTNGTVAKAKYTPTVYEVKSDTQVATVTYKDTNGTILGEVDILQGDSGSEMNYSTAERINALKKLGYELVSDEFTKADGSKQSFDNDTNVIQKFVVTVQPRLVPVIPSDVTPVPGQPINPEDPNSPVWPESVKELTTSEEVTRTITYVDGDGKEVTTSVTSSVKFTRDAKVNLVTGEVTYGEWKAATTDVLSGNKLPLVKGYIAVSGDIEASTEDQTVKAEDKDIIQKVVYKKLGALIPNVPGQTNPPRIDYPNDPNGDPTKPGVPTEDIVIPYVPGYIPRDKDGNPLKPVDPEDPTKGYVPPTLPTDPSQDTPINYTKITTSYVTVDPNGKEVPIPEYPTVEGNQPKKAIPGYDFVKTTTDKDGNVTHVYRKVVKTTTSFVDESGKPVSPNEEGSQPKKAIPGYEFVKTTTDKDGNVTHVYRKVVKTTTSFVDESGKPVSPNEEGSQPKKAIPGYEFVKTTTDKDGNVTHVYRKVVKTTTSFVDESGKPVSPNEEGSQPKKAIPGYEFVKTTTDKDGNVTHVYRKVVKTTTSFVDESGKPVSPNEEGSQPKKDIPGYEFVKTTTDKDGNVTHVYRKVTPPTPQPTPAQPVPPTAVKEAEAKRELPNTGTEDNASLATLGLLGVLSGFGLVARKKKED